MKISKPIVFLAFANDRTTGGDYLDQLSRELRGIRQAFYEAKNSGLCEVVERSNLTIGDLLDVFQEYQGRIAIFHYGGHAGSFQLLLESAEKGTQAAFREGIVSFLARQLGLKLVFLNGCSTAQHAEALVEKGVPAVIGTSAAISDAVARLLAERFYRQIGRGASLKQAWDDAGDNVKMTYRPTDFYRNLQFTKGKKQQLTKLPWQLFLKAGEEEIKHWNLPDAVGDPLHGLPAIPKAIPLPAEPFQFIRRYDKSHAHVFFGRAAYIRSLFQMAENRQGPPIILLYGASGTGKSSLIEAGLLPRLEQSQELSLQSPRRDKGLYQILSEELERKYQAATNSRPQQDPRASASHPNEESGIQVIIEQIKTEIEHLEAGTGEHLQKIRNALQAMEQHGEQLLDELSAAKGSDPPFIPDQSLITKSLFHWLSIERKIGKPLTFVFDQFERILTQGVATAQAEVDAFFEELKACFKDPLLRPAGKIILSYRKEYLPEIEQLCQKYQLPRGYVYLKPLEREQVAEVVQGLASTELLRQHYQLEIDEDLPLQIADRLINDKEIALAPVLQILLTKMWRKTKALNPSAPAFTKALLDEELSAGFLLQDFLFQQFEKLKKRHPEAVESGLAIDLLFYHTSVVGTAQWRHRSEIEKAYGGSKEKLDALISACIDHYLLSEKEQATILCHDTLSALIQATWQQSERPGQRARRILESRIQNAPTGESPTALNKQDLQEVLNGEMGMRERTKQEAQLIQDSYEIIAQRKRRNQILQYSIYGLIAAVLVFSVIAWIQNVKYRTTNGRLTEVRQEVEVVEKGLMAQQKEVKQTKSELAQLEGDVKEKDQEISEKEETIDALALKEKQQRRRFESSILAVDAISLAGLPALEKALAAWQLDQNPNSERALIELWARMPFAVEKEQGAWPAQPKLAKGGYRLELSTQKDAIALLKPGGVEVLSLAVPSSYAVKEVSFSADGYAVLAKSYERKAPLLEWLLLAPTSFPLSHQQNVIHFDVSANQQYSSFVGGGRLVIWDLNNRRQPLQSKAIPNVFSANFNRKQSQLVVAEGFSPVSVRNLRGEVLFYLKDPSRSGDTFYACFSNDESKILSAQESEVLSWDVNSRKRIQVMSGHRNKINYLAFSEDDQYIVSASRDTTARVWDENGSVQDPLPHPAEVRMAQFSPDGRLVATACHDGYGRLWDWRKNKVIRVFRHAATVNSIAFFDNGKKLVTASSDQAVKIWSLAGKELLTLRFNTIVQSAKVSQDGNWLFVALRNGEIRQYLIDPNSIAQLIDRYYPSSPIQN